METDDPEIQRSLMDLLRRNLQDGKEFWSKGIQQMLFTLPHKEIIEGDVDGPADGTLDKGVRK